MISYFRRRWFVEAEDFWEPFQCPTASLGPVVPTHLHTVGNTEASRERWRWIEMNWWTQIVFLSGLSLYSGLIVFFPCQLHGWHRGQLLWNSCAVAPVFQKVRMNIFQVWHGTPCLWKILLPFSRVSRRYRDSRQLKTWRSPRSPIKNTVKKAGKMHWRVDAIDATPLWATSVLWGCASRWKGAHLRWMPCSGVWKQRTAVAVEFSMKTI